MLSDLRISPCRGDFTESALSESRHRLISNRVKCVEGGKVTDTALLNRNNAISVDPHQRTKELQDVSALLIAKSRALRLRAGESLLSSPTARRERAD
jgi:hypothetical protein